MTDATFLQNGTTHTASDPLRYESAMLERWFDARFGRFATTGRDVTRR